MSVLQLDLYNQRILEKREQQYKEMLARKKVEKNNGGALPAPGIRTLLYSLTRNIWITEICVSTFSKDQFSVR